MSFCTVVNCMDGRVQLPVIHYLQERFDVLYVDSVTEPGPVRLLAEEPNSPLTESILSRVKISVDVHGSSQVAVVAHVDCAGNPTEDKKQRQQLADSVEFLAKKFPNVKVHGLWLDKSWSVTAV